MVKVPITDTVDVEAILILTPLKKRLWLEAIVKSVLALPPTVRVVDDPDKVTDPVVIVNELIAKVGTPVIVYVPAVLNTMSSAAIGAISPLQLAAVVHTSVPAPPSQVLIAAFESKEIKNTAKTSKAKLAEIFLVLFSMFLKIKFIQ